MFKMLNKKIFAFSIAEAMVTLTIFAVVAGASAPLISKQVQNQNFNDIQYRLLKESMIPKHSIMFFNLKECPKGWGPVATETNGLEGKYPRIAKEKSPDIGMTKEQMVHKHKHISPYMGFYHIAMMNTFRYGPYQVPASLYVYSDNELFFPGGGSVKGYGEYPIMPNMNGILPKDLSNLSTSQTTLYGLAYNGGWNYSTLTYTSDGVNREEELFSTKSGYQMEIKKMVVCPNRDEGDKVCKPSGNNYEIPYLSQMPLVGDENRPNTVVWLACEKL